MNNLRDILGSVVDLAWLLTLVVVCAIVTVVGLACAMVVGIGFALVWACYLVAAAFIPRRT